MSVLPRLREAIERGERAVLFTVVEGEPLGAKLLVLESGEMLGDGPEALAGEGIVTSCRDDNLRISAHCYNTAEDVKAVLDVLAARRELLA